MSTQIVTVKSEGMTLPRVIWQFLRRQPSGYLEVVLDHNIGLADLGPILPVGTEINFPLDLIPQAPTRALIKLWD